VVSVPAPATTVFEYGASRDAAGQRLAAIARPLAAADVPEDWRDAPLVLLAPVIDEVDAHVVTAFPEASIGAAAQGWLRSLTPDGEVVGRAWAPPQLLLGRLQTLVVSADDVRGQEAAALEWAQRVPVMAVTAGRDGAALYVNGYRYEVRAHRARPIDTTGAGDVFAAALLIAYDRSGDPWEAAETAACAAALSIEAEGQAAVPDGAALEAALAEYRAG
jgi:sugar/nucleoside kinase (ribokinase family)